MVKNALIWFRALYVFGSILVVPPIVGAIVAMIVYGMKAIFCLFANYPVHIDALTSFMAGVFGTAVCVCMLGFLLFNLVTEWDALKTFIQGKKE